MMRQAICTMALCLLPSVAVAQPATGEQSPEDPETASPERDDASGVAEPPQSAPAPAAATPGAPQQSEPAAPKDSAAPPAGAGVPPGSELKPAGTPAPPAAGQAPPSADLKQPQPAATAAIKPPSSPSRPVSRVSAPVAPATEDVEDIEEPYTGPLGSHQSHLFAWIGMRNDYVRDHRYDLFSDNDALPAFSLGAGGVVFAVDRVSVAAVGLWEPGSYGEDVRGDETDLALHRLQVGGELRYHVVYRWFGFVRGSLGPTYARALLKSRVTQSNWIARRWLFAGAASAGTAWRLFGDPSGERRKPRLWVSAEGGYGFSSEMPLHFEPDPEDAASPERGQVQELGTMSLNAPFFRLALAGSY